jgi:hypothetical protein
MTIPSVSNLDLDTLLTVLDQVADKVREIRRKKPAARNPAELLPLAKSLQLAVRGMEKAAGQVAAEPVPEKTHRRVRK